MKQRLDEVLKITAPEAGLYDYDGKPITAEELWARYFAIDPGILRRYLNGLKKAALAESEHKNTGEVENPLNSGIFYTT